MTARPGPADPADPAGIGARIERVLRPEVRALRAYGVHEATGAIKLDAMENPYGWPEPLVAAWLERLRTVPVNRYPDPHAPALRARMRETFAIPDGLGLLLGNGSDELIQLLFHAAGGPGRTVLVTDPSFAMYRLVAAATGTGLVSVALDARDHSLPRTATLEALEAAAPSLVLLAYPNNPTGNLFDRALVEEIIERAPGLVVIDEAYEPFARTSFLELAAARPNLLVMRTVSKLGLAGLRLGYLVGHDAWLTELDKLRLPYNVGSLTQVSAEVALEHYDVLLEQTDRIRAERERLYAALRGRNRLTAWPSDANFILVRLPAGTAGSVCAGLLEHGVLVRNLDGAGLSLSDCIRISVGTPAENDVFLSALDKVLAVATHCNT